MSEISDDMKDNDVPFLSFKEAGKRYQSAGLNESSFRWFRFHGDTNGFNECVIEIAASGKHSKRKKLALVIPRFERWLLKQGKL